MEDDKTQEEENQPDMSLLVDDGEGNQVSVGEMIDRGRNKTSWQKSLKQNEMAVAEERKSLNSLVNRVVDTAVTAAPTDSEEIETVSDFDLQAEMSNLPDSVEDPEGHKAGLADVMRKQGEFITQQAETRAQEKVQEERNRNAAEMANRDSGSESRDNEERFNRWVDKNHPELTSDQRADLQNAVGSLHGETYGEPMVYGNRRVWKYNETAYEAALGMVPSIRNQMTQEAVRNASTGDGESGAGQANVNALPQPAPNASRNEKIRWLRSLDEASAERAVAGLSETERHDLAVAAYDDAVNQTAA